MERKNTSKVHVVMLPFPIVGRTNPMVHLGKGLSSKGLLVTIATTSAFASKIKSSNLMTVATLDDDDDTISSPSDTLNMDEYLERYERRAPHILATLIKEQEQLGSPVRCLIYDSSQIWALPLARQLGIFAAPFFPQSCAVSLIFRHAFTGDLVASTNVVERVVSAPGLPPMSVSDLPSFVQEAGRFPILEKLVLRQFENFDDADWHFFNTFDALEQQVVDWMRKQWGERVKSIGPCIPSMYLEDDDNKECEDADCIRWLDGKEEGSTVYVSFGSLAALEDAQMQELASALTHSGHPFLWVVRDRNKLKLDESSSANNSNHMIVNWCPQLAVLAHRAVGCFLTHCGWNSTLEAVSCGVPLVAMPQWADQPTNAMFVEHVWRVGVRAKAEAAGLVTRQEIQACIREVMQGNKAQQMRSNASKLMLQAKDAMLQGGSSHANLDVFVAKLIQP